MEDRILRINYTNNRSNHFFLILNLPNLGNLA